MNKKGFTLVEVLAVIALIGVLLMLVTPNLIKIFSNSVESSMKIQEGEIKDTSIMYLEDYCVDKLPDKVCPSTLKRNASNKFDGYVKLSTLVSEEYIEEVSLQGSVCTGCVIYKDNKPSVYLDCGEGYITKSEVDFKSVCNLN